MIRLYRKLLNTHQYKYKFKAQNKLYFVNAEPSYKMLIAPQRLLSFYSILIANKTNTNPYISDWIASVFWQ